MRKFVYDTREIKDPNPELTPDQVRAHYASFYPELATAEIQHKTEENGDEVYTFIRKVGTKGDFRR